MCNGENVCRMHYDGEAPVAAEPETETETVDDTEDDEETDAAAAAAVTPSTAAAAAQPARERRSAWSLTAGMHTDEALLNVPQPNWASVVVDSAEVHKGPEGPLLQALSSRDAIDDLPLRVEAGVPPSLIWSADCDRSVACKQGMQSIRAMNALHNYSQCYGHVSIL